MTDQEMQELSDDRAAMLAAKAELQEDLATVAISCNLAQKAFDTASAALDEAQYLFDDLAHEIEYFEENW
jgi:hypothetical protein